MNNCILLRINLSLNLYMSSCMFVFMCVSRRNRGWRTNWKTPVYAWRMKWTSTGKWWTNWDRTGSSSTKKRKKCRRWEGQFEADRHFVCSSAHVVSTRLSFATLTELCISMLSLTLFIFPLHVVDRGPASRAGAFAAVQAGKREAWPWPQLFFWAGWLQQ